LSSNEKHNNNKNKNKKKIDKKGAVITLFIVIGIVGASFIVWFLPQGKLQNSSTGGNNMIFSNPNDTLISVNNQYMVLKDAVNNILSGISKSNQANLTQVKNSIDISIKQNNELMQTLLHGNPSGSLVASYVKSMNILKNFSFYLDDVKNITSSPSSLTTNLTKNLMDSKKKWFIS
jgi:hypothetical protein